MRLRAWMNKKGISYKDLSEMLEAAGCKVSISALTKWGQGQRTPRPWRIIAIMKVSDGAVGPMDWIDDRADHG